MKISFTTKPIGLGTAIKTVINGLATPLPARVRRRLRNCPGCANRAAHLDAAMPNINPLATKPVASIE